MRRRSADNDAMLAYNANSLVQQRSRLHQALLGPAAAKAAATVRMPAEQDTAASLVEEDDYQAAEPRDRDFELSAMDQFATFLRRSKAAQVTADRNRMVMCHRLCLAAASIASNVSSRRVYACMQLTACIAKAAPAGLTWSWVADSVATCCDWAGGPVVGH